MGRNRTSQEFLTIEKKIDRLESEIELLVYRLTKKQDRRVIDVTTQLLYSSDMREAAGYLRQSLNCLRVSKRIITQIVDLRAGKVFRLPP